MQFPLWDNAHSIQGDARRYGVGRLRENALSVMSISGSPHVDGDSYMASLGHLLFGALFELALYARRLFEEAQLLDRELLPAMCHTPGTAHFDAVGGTSNDVSLQTEKLRFVLNAIVHSTNLSMLTKRIATESYYGENTLITAVGATTDKGRAVVFCPNAFARTCLAFSIEPPPATSKTAN
ncbi:MAG: hypothetical protein H6895_02835 [Defluviimonas sp.]|uniref:hypothetical protein n=1 Tax=Albidovulum sp. TaxID=1872424 RepID=UPI002A324430|nr:hypothetical protein [Defluviimonas sp.]